MVELLVSGALFSVMAGSIYLLYTTMQSTMTHGELKADLQQNARVGLAQMVLEIRSAGYDPEGAVPLVTPPPKAAIRGATPTCLSFVSSIKNQATGVDESKQITYDFDSGAKTLRRRVDDWKSGTSAFSGGSPQPLAESMNFLKFSYFGADNQELVPASGTSTRGCPPGGTVTVGTQLSYVEMRQIRRVTIVLRTWGDKSKWPGLSTDQFYTLTSDVRIRNK